MKIIHAADIHLGRKRLEGRLPASDFAVAFAGIANQAIARKADVFLLAGDLFDRPQIEPPHLREAQAVLATLKSAGIPVIAITGNHDKAFINSQEETWLEYLADDELLMLLATRFGPDGPILDAWNPATRRGAWCDLAGVRFTGAGYLGAATPHKVRQIAERLEPGRPNVLLLHAGPDYFVGEGGGFSTEDLRILRERVVYLALGHIHKPMIHGGWACNPGSPENCDLQESHYDRDKNGAVRPRGYAWLEIDPSLPNPLRAVEICSNPRRPVFHLELDCTPFGNKLKNGATALEEAACELIGQKGCPSEAAVELRLTGKINLARIALDLQLAARNIEQAAGVKAVALDAATINLDGLLVPGNAEVGALSRDAMERASIRSVVTDEQLWGLADEVENIADLFFALKEGVRKNLPEEALAEQIQASALIEKIQQATAATTSTTASDSNGGAA